MRPHLVTVVLAASLAPAASAVAADSALDLDAEVAAGADSNPERALQNAGTPDAFVSGLVRAGAKVAGGRFAAAAQLAEAVRLYAATDATAIGSRLEASAQYAAADHLTVGTAVLASDLTERGHRLDQDVLDAVATLGSSAGAWRFHAGAGWDVFSPRPEPLRPFLASGPRAVAGASWFFRNGEALSAAYDFAAPSYPRWMGFAGTSRDDRTHTLSAEVAHRGSFVAAAGYAYTWNRSSAAGGAFDRHRVHARAAVYLSDEITLALRAALQWSSYPEPLYLTQQLLLAEGQQNLDSLEVRLTRALTPTLDLLFSIALYRAEAAVAPGDVPSFTRAVGSLGFGWRLGRE